MPRNKTQQAAYDKIARLTEHFAAEIESLKMMQKETQTRIGYIDPLFEALGWDVSNTLLRRPVAYKDVIHEDKLKIGGKTKAPDYCFTNYGKKLFFLEAKKPAILIKTDTAPSYQLRRYGWSAKLPISLLTDFEEFALYDCTMRPKETDSAAVGRLKYLTYDQYLTEFDWLWDLFAKEQVLKGSLDQFAKTDKKGTQSVDYAFLQSLDEWRSLLASNIAARNTHLTEDDINYIVQINLNRIVFLRNCEDREAENYGNLKDCITTAKTEGTFFKNMYRLFADADAKYNSGLFDPTKDALSKNIVIDNAVVQSIIDELYYPKSPYEFSVIGAEILGTAYERFLGKVIRLNAQHQVTIEEKPEVRKAGGVFYTPQYIVEYIVKNTIGKLIEGKTPNEIAALKICDPACGSGSFLLGAYQYLLDYHTDWYAQHYKKSRAAKDSPLTPDGNLTTPIKKEILLNNIYGVDIDTQAVEVTKLSLLIKCMEGETQASLQTILTFERVLPTLENNIKSGNSLIDFDFYDGQIDFDPQTEKKVKPFNWKQAFPEVFRARKALSGTTDELQKELKAQFQRVVKTDEYAQNLIDRLTHLDEPDGLYETNAPIISSGGFDVVIGNPPYGAVFQDDAKMYLRKMYDTFVWRGESYAVFVEKALGLLRKNGLLGFIIPDTYLNLAFTQSLRQTLLQNSKLQEIVVLPTNVFADATVDTTLLFTQKANKAKDYHDVMVLVKNFGKKEILLTIETPQKSFFTSTKQWFLNNSFNVVSASVELTIIERIDRTFGILENIANMHSGIKSYEIGKGKPPQTEKIKETKPFTSVKQENSTWLPFFDGKHIGKYQNFWCENNWIKYGEWLAAPRDPAIFLDEKILIRKIIGKTLVATYIDKTSYCNTLLFVLKLKPNTTVNYKYLLGVLNSAFIGWYFRKKFQIAPDDTFPQIMIRDILQFAIPTSPSKQQHDEIVKNVDLLLKLNADLQTETDPAKKAQMQGRVAYAEQRIDEIVYQLYGLTGEEIQIIESQ